MSEERKPVVPLDTYVHPWGKVAAVRWDGRERFYLLVDYHGCVSLMPADVVEAAHAN